MVEADAVDEEATQQPVRVLITAMLPWFDVLGGSTRSYATVLPPVWREQTLCLCSR